MNKIKNRNRIELINICHRNIRNIRCLKKRNSKKKEKKEEIFDETEKLIARGIKLREKEERYRLPDTWNFA